MPVKTAFILLQLLSSFSFAGTDSIGAYIKVQEPYQTTKVETCLELDKNFSDKVPAPLGTIAKKAEKVKGFQNLKMCGYIAARGQSVKRKDYPELYKAIGCNWGCRNTQSFTLPQFSTQFFLGR